MFRVFLQFATSLVLLFSTYVGLASDDSSINNTMVELGETINALSPEIFSERNDPPENPAEFKAQFKKLSRLMHKAEQHIYKRPITYNISYDLLTQYLEDINIVLNRGEYALAKGMLKSVPSLCVGCHTQESRQKVLFNNINRSQFENDFQYAEYLYLTRNYNRAVEFYNRYILSTQASNSEHILSALQRILVINLQILKKPKLAMQQLRQYANSASIDKDIRQNIQDWLSGLSELDNNSADPALSLDSQKKYIEYYLNQLANHSSNYLASEKDKIFYITLRGLLYEYLNANPIVNDVPIVLYWLSVCDRTLGYTYFDGLADIYLKECILTYPNHPFAKKCFSEYEAFMRFAYTGSNGLNLPVDIEQEIDILRNVVERANKGDVKDLHATDDGPIRN